MKSMLLAAAAFTLATSAYAQSTDNMAAPASNGPFVTHQETGIVRAPKLVGVSVYDRDNKNVGKVADILLDKSGKVQAVVIGVGGFLGIGAKDIALPYEAVKWQTEQRTVATNGTAPGAGTTATNTTGTASNSGSMTGTTANNAAAPAQKTVDPAQQEAYNGYPDRAVIDMSQDQLKSAPEFKYASQTANSAADVGNGNTTAK